MHPGAAVVGVQVFEIDAIERVVPPQKRGVRGGITALLERGRTAERRLRMDGEVDCAAI